MEDRREVEGAMWDRKAIRVVRRAVFLKRDMFLCVFQSVRSGEAKQSVEPKLNFNQLRQEHGIQRTTTTAGCWLGDKEE